MHNKSSLLSFAPYIIEKIIKQIIKNHIEETKVISITLIVLSNIVLLKENNEIKLNIISTIDPFFIEWLSFIIQLIPINISMYIIWKYGDLVA